MATLLYHKPLNFSNVQTAALGCILLSVIISIFTWYTSWGSNAHNQQQTALIHSQNYVLNPMDSALWEVLIKLNDKYKAAPDLGLWRLCSAASWPVPGAPPCARFYQYASNSGSQQFHPEPNHERMLLSAGSSHTKHRMVNTLQSPLVISKSSEEPLNAPR